MIVVCWWLGATPVFRVAKQMLCLDRSLVAFWVQSGSILGALWTGAVPVFLAAGGGVMRRTVASWCDIRVLLVCGYASASVGQAKAVLGS